MCHVTWEDCRVLGVWPQNYLNRAIEWQSVNLNILPRREIPSIIHEKPCHMCQPLSLTQALPSCWWCWKVWGKKFHRINVATCCQISAQRPFCPNKYNSTTKLPVPSSQRQHFSFSVLIIFDLLWEALKWEQQTLHFCPQGVKCIAWSREIISS